MTHLAALSAAALLAGLTASPLGAAPPLQGDVSVQAGQAVWHGETGTYDLSGGVVLQRGAVVLRARTARLDPETGEVQADGDVLLVDASRAVHAEGIHAVLDGPFEASQVLVFLKEKPLEPERVTSLAEARQGRNRATFQADRVEGQDEEHLTVQGARFTLCDCGEGKEPTWQLRAPRAKVEGDRVALSWPVLYVTPRILLVQRPVPVLLLPWLSLPLRDRQTGLLFPEVGSNSTTGWYFRQPVFVTLGRSADLTATPEYFFGPESPHRSAGAVKGPGMQLELRWAPAERTEGQVLLHLLDDEDRERLDDGTPGGSGLRLSIEGSHRQDLGPATRLTLDLSLAQDAFLFRDLRGNQLPSDPYYSRSDARLSRRGEDLVAEVGASYLEPLAHGTGPRPGEPSWFGAGLPATQRWPSAGVTLLPVELGPLQVEGRAGVSRFAPLEGGTGELLPSDPGYFWAGAVHLADGTVALPRPATSRAEGRLRLSAPRLLGGLLAVEPFLAGAANGYAFDDRPAAAAAWGMGGLSAEAGLARRYGAVEHRVVPRVELVAGTDTWRERPGDPFPAYDPWDRVEAGRAVTVVDAAGEEVQATLVQKLSAAPDGAYTQARISLENRLEAGRAGRLGLELGQDVDLHRGKLAESWGSLSLARGPFSSGLGARMLAFGGRPARTAGWAPSWLDAFTQLHAGASLRDGRGDRIGASLDSTGSGAVGAQGAGVDALFELRPSGAAPDAWAGASTHLVLGGATVDYGVRMAARAVPSWDCPGGGQIALDAGEIAEHDVALTWDSPCHCFTAQVRMTRSACGTDTFKFSVDLSKILRGAARPGG